MPVECERLQGFPEGWTLPEALEVSDPDKIDTLRYNALGNAVTVPVAEWLAHRIKAYLSKPDARSSQQFSHRANGNGRAKDELAAAFAK